MENTNTGGGSAGDQQSARRTPSIQGEPIEEGEKQQWELYFKGNDPAKWNFYYTAVYYAHILLAPFALSPKKVALLKAKLGEKKMKILALIFDMETRWWIKGRMIARLCDLLPAFDGMTTEGVMKYLEIPTKTYPDWEKAHEWYKVNMLVQGTGLSPLRQLLEVLKHGEIWSSIWETRNFPAISLVYPGYLHLERVWDSANTNNLMHYEESIQKVATMLQKNLRNRFGKSFKDGLLYSATFLDPLTHDVLDKAKFDCSDMTNKAIHFMATHCFKHQYFPKAATFVYNDPESAIMKTLKRGLNDGDHTDATTKLKGLFIPFKAAMKTAIAKEMYVLDFYRDMENGEIVGIDGATLEEAPIQPIPIIKLAKDVFGGKAGSSASEAIFSIAKHGFPANRSTADPFYAANRAQARMSFLERRQKMQERYHSSV